MKNNYLNSQEYRDNALGDQKFFTDIIDPANKDGHKEIHHRYLSGSKNFRVTALNLFLELLHHPGFELIF